MLVEKHKLEMMVNGTEITVVKPGSGLEVWLYLYFSYLRSLFLVFRVNKIIQLFNSKIIMC